MKNNKPISQKDIKIGARVKVGIPRVYACSRNKDMHKSLSWFKGKISEINQNSITVTIYPKWYMGRVIFFNSHWKRIIKAK